MIRAWTAARTLQLLAIFGFFSSTPVHSAGAPVDVRPLSELIVLSQGRLKPLATLARESVTQGELPRIPGLSALRICVRSFLDPESMASVRYLRPRTDEEREVFGEKLLSPQEVVQFWDGRLQAFHAQGPTEGRARRMEVDRLNELWHKVARLYSAAKKVLEGRHVAFLPDPRSKEGAYLSYPEAKEALQNGVKELSEGIAAFEALKEAYQKGDSASFAFASRKLKAAQQSLARKLEDQLRRAGLRIPTAGLIRVELLYEAVDFRIVGLVLFLVSSVLFFLSLKFDRGSLRALCTAVFACANLWNVWVIAARTAIGGRLPLKNLNEVFLVVLFFVPLIGALLTFLLKGRIYALSASALAAVGYVGSFFLPAHGYVITPLVAILQSWWREIHVLTIMLSYAILLVAAGLHAIFLLNRRPEIRNNLFTTGYHTLAWGFLFLTIGIATGAGWADASWGRYWGWDPKEVWALIAWLIYALFLHLRIFFKVRREVLAVVSLIGYAAILFTYFGVSYLLPGLHSYA